MYKIETNFAFPLIKINALVRYTQVKKPTGISYFLLVLINENSDRNIKISALLKQFGVPLDLHELFAEEIQKLINLGIITSNPPYNKSYFEEYALNTFSFTIKGIKIFRDEAIPLEGNVEIKQNIFFNPALNKLELASNKNYGDIKNSVLSVDFFKQFELPDEYLIEEFLNSKKSNGIPIKKEEVILNTQILGAENVFITYPIIIQFDETDTITFDFEEPKLKTFFEQHYTNDMISSGLGLKNKFNFENGATLNSHLSKEFPLNNVFVPEEIKKIQSIRSFVDITKEPFETSNYKLRYSLSDEVTSLYKGGAFIKIIDMTHAYIYAPSLIKTNNPIFGEIEIKLLLEKRIEDSKIRDIIEKLISLHHSFDGEDEHELSFKKLLQLCKFINNMKYLNQLIDQWVIKEEIETKIILLGRIRDKSTSEPQIYQFIKNKGLELLDEYLSTTELINLENRLSIANWIITSNKLTNTRVLEKIFMSSGIIDADPILLFDSLEKLNFKYEDIFLYHKKVIPLLFQDNNSISKLSNLIRTLISSLDNLKNITNIQEISNYSLKEISDREAFINHFKVFSEMISNLDFIRKFDPILDKFHQFHDIFSKLFELFLAEKLALGNPKAITEKLVDSEIHNGNVLIVIANLYTKLTYICNKQFLIDKDFSEMINDLEKSNFINKDESEILHKFRQYRNDLLHAKPIRQSLNKDDFIAVKKIIFRLEVVKS